MIEKSENYCCELCGRLIKGYCENTNGFIKCLNCLNCFEKKEKDYIKLLKENIKIFIDYAFLDEKEKISLNDTLNNWIKNVDFKEDLKELLK